MPKTPHSSLNLSIFARAFGARWLVPLVAILRRRCHCRHRRSLVRAARGHLATLSLPTSAIAGWCRSRPSCGDSVTAAFGARWLGPLVAILRLCRCRLRRSLVSAARGHLAATLSLALATRRAVFYAARPAK